MKVLNSITTLSLAIMVGCSTAPRPAENATQETRLPSEHPTPLPRDATRAAQQEFSPAEAPAPPATVMLPANGDWVTLLDEQSVDAWQPIQFGGEGEVEQEGGALVLQRGESLTGVRFTRAVPVMNYEIELEAVRLQGVDFFCALTVPVGESHCSLVVGGWGGTVLGISSLDGLDASENDTARFLKFEEGRWYRLRLRVTEGRIEAWLENEKVVDVATQDRRVGLRPGMIEWSRPLGICSYQTKAGVRHVRLRAVRARD